MILQLGETVTFAPTRVVEKARELQKIMNLAGAHLLEDGKAGMKLWKIKLEYPGILSASHIALRLDVISIHTFIMAIH